MFKEQTGSGECVFASTLLNCLFTEGREECEWIHVKKKQRTTCKTIWWFANSIYCHKQYEFVTYAGMSLFHFALHEKWIATDKFTLSNYGITPWHNDIDTIWLYLKWVIKNDVDRAADEFHIYEIIPFQLPCLKQQTGCGKCV